ncbi:MAG: hypothetical protein GX608_12860 [Lentisphaerae bacterium]|nr:hypothetical protein [Lentisphaerota bacterium]
MTHISCTAGAVVLLVLLAAQAVSGQSFRSMEQKLAAQKPPVKVDPIRGYRTRTLNEFPDGSRILNLDLQGRKLYMREADGRERVVPFDYDAGAIQIAVLCAGPDGKIYGATAHPSQLFVYDPALNELYFYPGNSIGLKSLRVQGKYVFGGQYTGGVFWLIDTSKPISWTPASSIRGRRISEPEPGAGAGANPLRLGGFAPDLNIPRNAFAHPAGKHIMISGQPGYGFVGGGLVIYNLETKKSAVLTHKNLYRDYSTMAIAAMPDGNLLCGTSPKGGHGTKAVHGRAALYILDMTNFKVVWQSGPLKEAGEILSMAAGPDNLYYCVDGGGKLLVYKVESRLHEEDVMDAISAKKSDAGTIMDEPDQGRRFHVEMNMVHQDPLEKYGGHTGNQAFTVGQDGKIYLGLRRGIIRITPGTFKVEEIAMPGRGVGAGLGIVSGRVYFASGGYLNSVALPESAGGPETSRIVSHGAPVMAAENRGMTAAVDGDGHRMALAWIAMGGTDKMLVIDVDGGAALKIPVEPYAGDNAFAVWHSKRGYFYSHYGSHFYEFDPKTLTFTFAARTAGRCAMSMHEDRNGVIWASLYSGAGLLSFDPETRKLVNHGSINSEGWGQYTSYMAADDAGWVYVGIGNTLGQLVGYNPATGERRTYVPQKSRRHGVGRPFTATDGRVYANAPNWGAHEMFAGEATPIESLEQRRMAGMSGDYEPGKGDYFIPARVFQQWEPVAAATNMLDELMLNEANAQPAVAWAPSGIPAEASRWLWKKDLDDSFELLLRARGGPCAGDLIVAFNGRELFNAPTPFKHEEASSLRLPVPDDALREQENLLTISFKPEEKAALEKQDAGGVKRMSVFYAVFKRSARK